MKFYRLLVSELREDPSNRSHRYVTLQRRLSDDPKIKKDRKTTMFLTK